MRSDGRTGTRILVHIRLMPVGLDYPPNLPERELETFWNRSFKLEVAMALHLRRFGRGDLMNQAICKQFSPSYTSQGEEQAVFFCGCFVFSSFPTEHSPNTLLQPCGLCLLVGSSSHRFSWTCASSLDEQRSQRTLSLRRLPLRMSDRTILLGSMLLPHG